MESDLIQEIQFFYQSAEKVELNAEEIIPFLSKLLIEQYNKTNFIINVVFLGSEDIQTMNRDYLGHNYATDIITFDYSDEFHIFAGDLFICPSVVFNNAVWLKMNAEEEFIRVICHGILHLLGFKDKEPVEIEKMREQEEICLKLYRAR
jgi:probable rRNA maturation factor